MDFLNTNIHQLQAELEDLHQQLENARRKTMEHYHVAEYRGIISHFVAETETEAWDFVSNQEDPSDYQVHSFPADEWDVWVK